MFALFAVICLIVCCPAYADESDYTQITGEIKDGLYINRTLGAEAYFDENWRVLSRKDIATLTGAAASDSPALEELTSGAMPVFCVSTKDGRANINITVIHLGVSASLLSDPDSVFMDMFAESARNGAANVLTEMGIKDFTAERMKTSFLGEEYHSVYSTSKLNGFINQYQKLVICIRGEYSITVTATSLGRDAIDEMLSMFRRIGS